MKSFMQLYRAARALPRVDGRYHYIDRPKDVLHVSEIIGCLRDAYWATTNTPKTNPPGESSETNFDVGNWIEQGIIRDILAQTAHLGFPLLGQQVEASLPLANGFTLKGHMDALLWDVENKEIVIWDAKTSHGWPTKMFLEAQKPKDNHVRQIALYVHMLQQKGYKARGELLYYMLGDPTWGKLASCTVKVGDKGEISYGGWATFAKPGEVGPFYEQGNVGDIIGDSRLQELRTAVEGRVVPLPEKKYRFDVTPAMLKGTASKDLERAIDGKKVLGDWETKYSDWKDLNLEIDKPNMKYSNAEIALMVAEMESRTFTKKRTLK